MTRRSAIEKTIPGFEEYNRKVREPGGFYLPNKPRYNEYPTATKKANFTVHELPLHKLEKGEFVLMTIRTHDQFNTTIYGLNDRYRGIHNERRVIFLNPKDIEELGFRNGQVVDLTSRFEAASAKRNASSCRMTFRAAAPRRIFPKRMFSCRSVRSPTAGNTPVSKFVVITIAPDQETARIGRFDYEYQNGDSRVNQMQKSKQEKQSLASKMNAGNLVGAAVGTFFIGAVAKLLLDKNK